MTTQEKESAILDILYYLSIESSPDYTLEALQSDYKLSLKESLTLYQEILTRRLES